MNLQMGSQTYLDVKIPLLWGDRAVVQDGRGRLSIIDLSGESARVEILADEPAPGVAFRPMLGGGIVILEGDSELYGYSPSEKLLTSISLGLPDCQIAPDATRIGTSTIAGNMISAGVGIRVLKKGGLAIGAPVPSKLAKLAV